MLDITFPFHEDGDFRFIDIEPDCIKFLLANSRASGNPTYPNPIIPIKADLSSIFVTEFLCSSFLLS